ncbi:hypothetical protein ZIOFF_015413 [Zingiber officinale]|uniref:RRM domain-containing protein n=1 Tax=Zingiber officinale TaxID=94328 RepID=A0A8J5I1F8_ZINOF|nr:hypothetical protein ZIOFF_015413 [Zingiber officinale]
MDRETGWYKGFGFVTFTSNEEASVAISGMDRKDVHGRMEEELGLDDGNYGADQGLRRDDDGRPKMREQQRSARDDPMALALGKETGG